MTENTPVYVVGIGASAGGLEALERFFENVPLDTGMAFVVVQHLSPDFRSLMDELLARRTQLPIRLVEDGMLVEPDHVYLIPPKKEMIIAGGRLLLSERENKQELSLPIDVFFRSLAQDCGKRAVAIVLSGGGSDGSRGIRAVHDAGGLVIVQDTGSAQFDGMPKTARDTNVATWVLTPQEMPHVLVEHKRRAEGKDPAPSPPPPAGVDRLYQMLQAEFGIDFTHYKPSTVTRRIERRLKLARTEDIDEYVDRLRSERSELDVLYRDLLIGVTRFFRNEQAFEVLERQVLPELLQKGPKDTPLRVWVAGCATGEEAYSIAIVLHELAQKHGGRPVKIFATDVHPGSLEIAARAIYDAETVASVSAARLERYFIHRGRDYQVVPDIRQMIVFAQHNVVRDAPFTRVDLISCRNLLIYLQPPAQQKVLGLFHFALNRGGVVFLGPSESPGSLTNDFETVDRHWRLYRKFSDVRMPLDPRVTTRNERPVVHGAALPQPAPRYSLASLLGTYDTLLDEHMPPSLLVTERGEIVHTWNGASRFLKRHDGRQGLDVLEAVDDELKIVLIGGMKRALKEPSALVFRNVRVKIDDDDDVYDVSIRAIRAKNAASTLHLLVSFATKKEPAARRPPTEIDLGEMSRAQVGALEAELSYTRENLQAAIEELETSNEELQAANEELLASNEELQSTNEELQSVNEELYTVNAEYQRKITELTELTNDMDNLLASTDVATIFLDEKLNIRKFTHQIAKTFNLLPQDVGRSIESFTHDIDHPALGDDLRKVLETGEPVEREIRDGRGHSYFLRVLPYRAKGAKGTPSGVVLTLIDVSGLKAAEDALFHERYLLDSLLLGVPDAIYFKDARGRIIRANSVMARRLGLKDPRDAEGKTPFELPDQAAALAAHRQDEVVMRTGAAQHYCLEARTGEDACWDLVTRLPLFDDKRNVVGVIGIFRDVTDQKKAEEKIQEAVRRRDQFLAMLSHELRNPLGAVVTATALLRAGLSDPERRARMLQILERQSQQMARLLDDLLEASRVTQNKIELKKLPVDLGTITRDAADAIRGLMEDRGITFNVDIESRPLIVDGDAARLQQIEVNLLSNAAKYTPRGGHVELSVKRVGHEVEICVRDNGVGIPKPMLESVFDLFVQSKHTLDRSDGGLGVGLTLVRSLVGMHGGTVSAQSEGNGKGSEFVVRLPLADGMAAITGPTRSRVRIRKGARVVVIEDNADSREMLCELVTLAGFECHGAEDGSLGLELVAKVHPAIAIVDVGLPGIDGFEVARALRAKPETASIYLIALTGYGQPADRAKAFAAGFDEHIVKPVQPDALTEILLEAQKPRDSVALPS